MNDQTRATGKLEQRIHDAERELFAATGADVSESVLELAQTGPAGTSALARTRPGGGPAPRCLGKRRHLGAVADQAARLPAAGRGPSRPRPVGPVTYRRGQVREHTRRLLDDIFDALGLDQVPVIGHSLGGMFALWHVAAGSGRICAVVAIGEPAVALPGVRVRMPLSLLTVRGLGLAVLRSPSPPRVYRRLLAQGLGRPTWRPRRTH